MRKLADIDILSDEGLRGRMVAWSLAFLVVGAAVCLLMFAAGVAEVFGRGWATAFFLASVAALPLHELVHAAAFKLLVPGARVTFGFKDAFIYTSANGAVATRAAELCVLLAPSVAVTAALAVAAAAAGRPALAAALAFAHLSGCAGDLLMCAEIVREPGCTHVADAEFGIVLLSGLDGGGVDPGHQGKQ